MAIKKHVESQNVSVTLLPRHINYLKLLKQQQAQTASDTIRRALDDYMKVNPVEMGEQFGQAMNAAGGENGGTASAGTGVEV